MTVPDDFGRFHDPNFRYELTYGDARRHREIPIKDARFAPSDSSDPDQMRSSNIRNIIDNVDRMNYDARTSYSLENRPHADMDNSQIRERLSRLPEYILDKDGKIAPVPHERFHPNSSPDRWELEQEMNLRDLESKTTLFHEKHPFSEDFQDLHRGEDFAFDEAWAVVKADTGMWDEIYAPMLAGTAGMGKLPYGKYTADFMPSSVVMDAIRTQDGMNGSSEYEFHSLYDDPMDVGDHGHNVPDLMESIMEHGYDPLALQKPISLEEAAGHGWNATGRPDPSFRFDISGRTDQHEGRHRAIALDRLGAPYIPYMGLSSFMPETFPPLHFPLGSEFRRDVVNAGRDLGGKIRPGGDPGYSLGAYMGHRGGRIMVPPSYLYGREFVPGMGRLLPVDREGNPLDTHTHINRLPGTLGDDWYRQQGWKVFHDD
jgi:hypothetical protein